MGQARKHWDSFETSERSSKGVFSSFVKKKGASLIGDYCVAIFWIFPLSPIRFLAVLAIWLTFVGLGWMQELGCDRWPSFQHACSERTGEKHDTPYCGTSENHSTNNPPRSNMTTQQKLAVSESYPIGRCHRLIASRKRRWWWDGMWTSTEVGKE